MEVQRHIERTVELLWSFLRIGNAAGLRSL